ICRGCHMPSSAWAAVDNTATTRAAVNRRRGTGPPWNESWHATLNLRHTGAAEANAGGHGGARGPGGRYNRASASGPPGHAMPPLTSQTPQIPSTMKALVKREAAKGIWMEEVPVPQPGPNEVLIKLEKTAICGTDLHIYLWD